MTKYRIAVFLLLLTCLGQSHAARASAAQRDLTTAMANGDLLRVTSSRVLVRWGQAWAGIRLTEGQEPRGGALFARERGLTLAYLLRRFPEGRPLPAALAGLSADTPLAGWTCNGKAAQLLLAPTDESAESLRMVTLPAHELLGLAALPRASRSSTSAIGSPEIAACGSTDEGDLLVVFKEQTSSAGAGSDELIFTAAQPLNPGLGTPLVLASCPRDGAAICVDRITSVSHIYPTKQGEGSGETDWRLLAQATASNSSMTTSIIVDLVLKPGRTQLATPWDGGAVASEPGVSRIVARDERILSWDGDSLALTELARGAPAATTRRLPVSPCSSSQMCGLSLAPDGTWAAAGSWGAYVGKGTVFRRLDIPLLVGDSGRMDLTHTGAPGSIALFGSEDSSIENIPFALPDNVTLAAGKGPRTGTVQRPLEAAPRQAVAWLRPETTLLPTDQFLFALPPPREQVRVVLTASPFDPRRHLAYEVPVGYQAPLPAPLPGDHGARSSRGDGSWWQEALGGRDVESLLEAHALVPQPVTVAVLDSGADLAHPDFHPLPRHGVPDNGAPALVLGHDFVDEDDEPQDEFGHGTHVSGLAKPPFHTFDEIRLLLVRVLDGQGRSNSIAIGRGFLYAARQGAEVVNASWGGGARTQFMSDAIGYAQSKGALVVTSAGNDGLNIDNEPPVPAHVPGVLAIGAMTEQVRRAAFSNYGRSAVFLFTPGKTILSLALGGGTKVMSGTSMAAPLFVAHAAAALGTGRRLGLYPGSTDWRKDLAERFCAAARDQGARDSRYTPLGRLSQCGSLSPLAVFSGLIDAARP